MYIDRNRVMIIPIVYFITFFSNLLGSTALEWTSSTTIPSGSTRLVCREQNVSLPWRYQLSSAEHLISVEWHYQATGQEQVTVASYVTGQFLTLPSMHSEVSFLPNAGLLMHNVSHDEEGLYTVVVNLELHGMLISDSKTVRLEVSDEGCSDTEAELEMLKLQLNLLTAQNQVLTEQNANLSALIHELHRTCEGTTTVIPTQTSTERTTTQEPGLPGSCTDIFRRHNTNGVYTIFLRGVSPLQVYCEQDLDHWGWAVIQRRQDGSVDFYRNWTEYTHGFGDLRGEFWLGLENIYLMTSSGDYSLRVDLTDWDNTTAFAIYDTFSISNESDNFTLHVGGYHGTAGNGLITSQPYWVHNGQAFTTFDRSNDDSPANCAVQFRGAWWFNSCFASNLNGIYNISSSIGISSENLKYQGVTWYDWHMDFRSYKKAEMKIRLNYHETVTEH